MRNFILFTLIYFFTTALAHAGTVVTLASEQGDYIGQGQVYEYNDDNAQFAYSNNFDNGITLRISNIPGEPNLNWTLNLAAPGEVPLEVGTYTGAERFPFQASDNPGLSFSGQGRGCNTVSGSFEVLEIEYDENGELMKLNANFEQFCGNSQSALRGTILFNTEPAPTPVGATIIGMEPYLVYCRNQTTGQRVYKRTSDTQVDCKELGLQVNPGDRILFYVRGVAE